MTDITTYPDINHLFAKDATELTEEEVRAICHRTVLMRKGFVDKNRKPAAPKKKPRKSDGVDLGEIKL